MTSLSWGNTEWLDQKAKKSSKLTFSFNIHIYPLLTWNMSGCLFFALAFSFLESIYFHKRNRPNILYKMVYLNIIVTMFVSMQLANLSIDV